MTGESNRRARLICRKRAKLGDEQLLQGLHPTKRLLVETTISLLETRGAEQVTSDDVLQISGVSKGSLYHHFADFSELMEYAQVFLFSRYVEFSIDRIEALVASARSREDILAGLRQVTISSQAPELARSRYFRVRAIATAIHNERMRAVFAVEQQRLTDSLAGLFAVAQDRGWATKRINPQTVGVFVQAYTIGRVIDDFPETHMDPDNWVELISTILEKLFFPVVMA